MLDDGQIDEAQAESLLDIYQRDGAPAALAAADIIPRDESIFDEAAILALLLLLIGERSARELTITQRIAAADRAHDIYQERAAAIPVDDLPTWAGDVVGLLATLYAVSYYIGGAGTVAESSRAALEAVQGEAAYISRFSDELAIRRMTGAEPSAAAIVARLAIYGALARVGMFVLFERREGDAVGWVYQYIAVDDRGTCGPCVGAQGYYLAGQGPMPGEVCLGRGRCRCKRERVYRPDVYRRLIGQ